MNKLTATTRCSDVLEHYQCHLCPFRTHFYVDIREHRKICNFQNGPNLKIEEYACAKTLERYECNQCEFSTLFRVDLLNHIQDHREITNAIKYDEYIEKNGVIMLKEDWENVEKYYCGHCYYSSNVKRYLRKHIIYTHMKRLKCALLPTTKVKQDGRQHENGKRFKCKLCSFRTLRDKSYLKRHMLYKHTPLDHVQLFSCEHCTFKTKTKEALTKHNYNIHAKVVNVKWFHCTKCEHRTKYKRDLQRHVECKHGEQKQLKCSLCDFTTTTQLYLRTHEKTRHTPEEQIQWYRCEYCDYKTVRKYLLSCHFNTKHACGDQIKWFECDQCKFKCKQEGILKAHKRTKHWHY